MMEFTVVDNGRTAMVIVDVTRIEIVGLPEDIRSMTLDIRGANVVDYMVDGLDVLSYMKNNQVDNELYLVTSSTIGLPGSMNIPDGLYYFRLVTNNTIIAEETVLFMPGLTEALELAVEENDFDIEITQEGYDFTTSTNRQGAELLAIAAALMAKLRYYAVKEDEVNINDTIDKLKRILTILKPDYEF